MRARAYAEIVCRNLNESLVLYVWMTEADSRVFILMKTLR